VDYKTRLDAIFSLHIRSKEANTDGYLSCYCCGKTIHWKQAQNMHYIPRQHLSTRYNEINCHAGCNECNNLLGGELEKYKLHLIEDYGENIIEELNRLKNQSVSMHKNEYKQLIKFYKQKIKKVL
jgi:5-methylcytosine-specific restriction endonuclease McrA